MLRYLMMLNPTKKLTMSYKVCFLVVMKCAFWSLIWAILPLFGWSRYTVEGLGISCSVEWEDHSINVLSYNITIFLFVFIIPIIILVLANVKIIKTVSYFIHHVK